MTLKRCDRVARQRNPLWGSYVGKFLRRVAQGRFEVADPELDQVDFIRLIVLVRTRTSDSRSRHGHLLSSSATVGTVAMLQWPRSPRNQPRKPRWSIAVSIRSVLVRRCSRDTATLVEWMTWASMPWARNQRASQKPSRPVSYATAIRVISFPALVASSFQRYKLQQHLRIGTNFLPGFALDTRDHAGDQPAGQTHFYNHGQCAILNEGGEACFAIVVGLLHNGSSVNER